MVAINIRNKMNMELVFIELQCFDDHCRSKIRTTDTNVYDVSKWFARVAFPFAVYNFVCEGSYPVFYIEDFDHYIFAIDLYVCRFWRAQRRVKYSTIFGPVYRVASEIFINCVF